MLAKKPCFALIAVLTLALGIAANITIFSWISATILDPVSGAARTGELVTVMICASAPRIDGNQPCTGEPELLSHCPDDAQRGARLFPSGLR